MKNHSHLVLLAGLCLALTGCGGGGGATTSTSNNLVATSVVGTAPADVCPNGGITVNGGIDSNGNKILDPEEITSTQYVCNGADGSNGLTALVLVTAEPAGANCATGGHKIEAGLDANANQVLDATEVSSVGYVCTGATGSTGSSGFNSLVSIVPEPAGQFCTYGGNKVSSGLDNNPANGVLDPAEITSSNYVCNGAPGPGVSWVHVTDSAVQAVSNTGYIADSTSQATITLPATAAVGDLVQVTGIGTGGWKIAQNDGQYVITNNIATGHDMWNKTSALLYHWTSVASSSDGTKLVAVSDRGIYTSSNSGNTWTLTSAPSNLPWTSVASSADGAKLVAAATSSSGGIYVSSDSGNTWTKTSAYAYLYTAVASSADGVKLVAADGTRILLSSNSGSTWTTAPPTVAAATYLASSADGTKLVAAAPGVMYISADSGSNWTRTSAPSVAWKSVASSADGSKLVAVADNDGIYTSPDSGINWVKTAAPTARWSAVSSSSDGAKLVAGVGAVAGPIYTSADSGVTWTQDASAPLVPWLSIASSSNGTRNVAAGVGVPLEGIYTSYATTTIGTAGWISGGQFDSVDLFCVKPNVFLIRSFVGPLKAQ